MDAKAINHAFLHGLTVEVWQDDELIGSGRIVEHTKDRTECSSKYRINAIFVVKWCDLEVTASTSADEELVW